MAAGSNAPIIIKRKKVIAGGGHHGGAWKVAIAFPLKKALCAGDFQKAAVPRIGTPFWRDTGTTRQNPTVLAWAVMAKSA